MPAPLTPFLVGLALTLSGCAISPDGLLVTAAGAVLASAGVPTVIGGKTTTTSTTTPTGSTAGVPSAGVTAVEAPPADEELARALAAANRERAATGAKPLGWSSALAQVARQHSEDMVARDYFDHRNPDGDSPFDRITAAGIRYGAAAENIAMNHSPDGEKVIAQWMKSPGHKANLLNGAYGRMGLGVATAGDGSRYWTQAFTN